MCMNPVSLMNRRSLPCTRKDTRQILLLTQETPPELLLNPRAPILPLDSGNQLITFFVFSFSRSIILHDFLKIILLLDKEYMH